MEVDVDRPVPPHVKFLEDGPVAEGVCPLDPEEGVLSALTLHPLLSLLLPELNLLIPPVFHELHELSVRHQVLRRLKARAVQLRGTELNVPSIHLACLYLLGPVPVYTFYTDQRVLWGFTPVFAIVRANLKRALRLDLLDWHSSDED